MKIFTDVSLDKEVSVNVVELIRILSPVRLYVRFGGANVKCISKFQCADSSKRAFQANKLHK